MYMKTKHSNNIMRGNEIFEILHESVDAIEREQPGEATLGDILEIVESMASIAMQLHECRNKLRKAKGLRPLDLHEWNL